jgi:translation initiation factor IF-3
MDWGKAKFDKEKKERESRKKAQTIDVKEVKYRPTIDAHDFEIKTNQAKRFLEHGKKVKVTVFFRFRQLRRPELGQQILDKVVTALADVAMVEARTSLEGRQMLLMLAPKAHAPAAAAKRPAPSTKPASAAQPQPAPRPQPELKAQSGGE